MGHLGDAVMKAYMCVICGFVYEETKGAPDQGIAPGTKWDQVPENWTCPDCGASKADFEMVEI
jgi:rubredoxin